MIHPMAVRPKCPGEEEEGGNEMENVGNMEYAILGKEDDSDIHFTFYHSWSEIQTRQRLIQTLQCQTLGRGIQTLRRWQNHNCRN